MINWTPDDLVPCDLVTRMYGRMRWEQPSVMQRNNEESVDVCY